MAGSLGGGWDEISALTRDQNRRVTWEFPPALGFPGRLTLSSGVPVTTTDVLAATTIYHTPYLGKASPEISVAVPATKYRLFDIFRYVDATNGPSLETVNWNQTSGAITGATNAAPIVIASAGHTLVVNDVVAIEGVTGNTGANSIWQVSAIVAGVSFTLHGSNGTGVYAGGGTWYKMNATTRASAISLLNGVYVKSSDGRLYLGTGCTTATSGQTEDSLANRFLWNYYNRVTRFCQYIDQTNHTYFGGFRYWNNASLVAKHCLVIGVMEERVQIFTSAQVTAGVAAQNVFAVTSPNLSSTTSAFGTFGIAQQQGLLGLIHLGTGGIYFPEAFTLFPVAENATLAVLATLNSVQSRVTYRG